MPENRLYGADFMRAAACLTVLFHHLSQRMGGNAKLDSIEWFRVFAQIGTFGVGMFFVLSGFLLARPFWQAFDAGAPMPSIRTYATRRAARILPGFWLALAASFVLGITVFRVPLDGWLVVRFVAGFLGISDWHWLTLFPVEINGPLWSIGFEITSYVLAAARSVGPLRPAGKDRDRLDIARRLARCHCAGASSALAVHQIRPRRPQPQRLGVGATRRSQVLDAALQSVRLLRDVRDRCPGRRASGPPRQVSPPVVRRVGARRNRARDLALFPAPQAPRPKWVRLARHPLRFPVVRAGRRAHPHGHAIVRLSRQGARQPGDPLHFEDLVRHLRLAQSGDRAHREVRAARSNSASSPTRWDTCWSVR